MRVGTKRGERLTVFHGSERPWIHLHIAEVVFSSEKIGVIVVDPGMKKISAKLKSASDKMASLPQFDEDTTAKLAREQT